MPEIKLVAVTPMETIVLEYLKTNASDVLAEKINKGTKSLWGALEYAKEQAEELPHDGSCVMVEDTVVWGWIIHFFEEDTIEQKKKYVPVKMAGKAKMKPKDDLTVKDMNKIVKAGVAANEKQTSMLTMLGVDGLKVTSAPAAATDPMAKLEEDASDMEEPKDAAPF